MFIFILRPALDVLFFPLALVYGLSGCIALLLAHNSLFRPMVHNLETTTSITTTKIATTAATAFIAGVLVCLIINQVPTNEQKRARWQRQWRRRLLGGSNKANTNDGTLVEDHIDLEDHDLSKAAANASLDSDSGANYSGDLLQGKGQRKVGQGIESCVGNTPLFRINSLSEATGCEILGKAEVSGLIFNSSISIVSDQSRK